jgi:hypothetical protein
MFRIPPESCSLATAKRKGTRLRWPVTRMPHGACEDEAGATGTAALQGIGGVGTAPEAYAARLTVAAR